MLCGYRTKSGGADLGTALAPPLPPESVRSKLSLGELESAASTMSGFPPALGLDGYRAGEGECAVERQPMRPLLPLSSACFTSESDSSRGVVCNSKWFDREWTWLRGDMSLDRRRLRRTCVPLRGGGIVRRQKKACLIAIATGTRESESSRDHNRACNAWESVICSAYMYIVNPNRQHRSRSSSGVTHSFASMTDSEVLLPILESTKHAVQDS